MTTYTTDMWYMHINTFINTCQRVTGIMKSQTNGITHEDSLLQLPFRGNCMNWVIGHILQSRDIMLTVLGDMPQLSEAEANLYKTGSEPIVDGSRALLLDDLLARYYVSTDRIIARMNESTPEFLLAPYSDTLTKLERLQGLIWHETYHIGQLEPLRQLAGKNDKVI